MFCALESKTKKFSVIDVRSGVVYMQRKQIQNKQKFCI